MRRKLLVVFIATMVVLTAAGVAAAESLIPAPAPSGPAPEEYVPQGVDSADTVAWSAAIQAYADDYEAMQNGSVYVPEPREPGEVRPVTGVLSNGEAIPTDYDEAYYEDGVLVPKLSVPATDSPIDEVPQAWHTSIEPDDALYLGYVEVESYGATGLKADVNVYNRHTLRDFYLIMMYNPSNAEDLIAFEIAEYTEGVFRPFLHIKRADGSEYTKWYTSTSVSSGWHNIKMARSSSTGRWTVYLDSATLESNLYWPTSPSNYYPLTQTEAFYETRYESVWDPGNHHAEIYLRTSNYSTWSKWTNGSWGAYLDSGLEAFLPYSGIPITNKYSYIQLQYSPDFYDWMMRS